jgi:hypothetical protein
MLRAPALMLVLGCALGVSAAAHAGEKEEKEKVHTLSAGNLKIDGKLDEDGAKVRLTHPDDGTSKELLAKVLMVKLGAGRYQIDLGSDDIDCVLAVQDKTGKQLAFDDDGGAGGAGLNSRLVFQAKDDTYKIVAASFGNTAGPFTLTIKQLGGDGGKAGDGKAIKLEGTVSPDDERVKVTGADIDMKLGLIKGNRTLPFPAKLHEVELESGSYKVEATAVDMVDPILVVQDGAGKQLAFDDDGAGFPNSRLTFQAAKAGAYKIYVGTIGGQGKYTLTVTKVAGKGDPKGDDPKNVDPKGGKVLDVGVRGVRLNGALSKETKSITYRVKLEEGKSYVIEMQAANQDQLDPFVEVHNAGGERLAHDDDGAGDLNSRLVFRAPASGVYTVVARSFNNFGMGDFTLSVKQQDE